MDSTPPEAPQDRPLTFFSAAIWSLIALMVNAVVVNITHEARPGAMFDPMSRAGCLALAYSVVLFGVLRLHEPQASIRHVLGLRAPSVLAVILALALGASMSLPTDWLDKVLQGRFPSVTSEADEEAAKAALAVTSVGKGVSLFFALGIIDPLLTELFYRGALFTPLRRTYRMETVIIGVAALESLANAPEPRIAFVLAIATVVFSWVRGVTGSVIPAMAAHFAFNAVSVIPMSLRRADIVPTRTLLLASGATAVASLIGLTLLSRTARAVDARSRDAGEVSL